MSKNTNLDDVTYDVGYADIDEFPTQGGTSVNNYDENSARSKLKVSDVAERIMNSQSAEEDSGVRKAVLFGVGFGLFIFALIVVFDVMMNS